MFPAYREEMENAMNIKPRRFGIAAVILAATIGASACGSNLSGESTGSTKSASGGPVVLGVLVDQTAYLKSIDGSVLNGINSAVKAINDKGGVQGGRQLKVVSGDMAADPQKGVQAFQRLVSQNKPVIFLNGFSSASTTATAPLAALQKVPMIVASVVPVQNADWAFSTITPAKYEAATRVEYLTKQGIKKVAILHDPTPYAKLNVAVITEQLKAAGIQITGVAEHATDTVDLRPQVSTLLSGSPQAVIKISAGPSQIVAAKAMADAGSKVPLLLGIESRANVVQATAAYPQVLVVAAPLSVYTALSDADRTEAMKSFVAANPNESDPTYAGRGWDAVNLAVAAIEKAGSTDGQAVRDALIAIGPYDGTSGVYDYTDSDRYGVTINPDYLARITDKTVEIVFAPKK